MAARRSCRLFGGCVLRRSANESSYEYVDMSKSGGGRKRRQHEEIQLHLGTIKKASIKGPKKRINNREIFANCCGTHT